MSYEQAKSQTSPSSEVPAQLTESYDLADSPFRGRTLDGGSSDPSVSRSSE